MKYFCLSLAFAVANSPCYSQWIQQQSKTARHLFGVDMVDAQTGYAVGEYQVIRKTTNGGNNWLIVNCPNLDYIDVSFINPNTGIVSAGPGSYLIQTYDGGASWTYRFTPRAPNAVQYIDSKVAYSAADYGVIRSTDGCVSWQVVDTSNFLGTFRGLYFINSNTGTVVGGRGTIRTTTNGGITWTQRIIYLPVQFGDSTLDDVIYVNALTGYASGNNGIVIKTSNSGSNWTYIPTGSLYRMHAVYFTDSNTGTVAGSAGIIYRTTNGGKNWVLQASPLNYPLWGINFVSRDTGWIVGFNGLILKTTNGGATWIEPISNDVPSEFRLYQNYPNPFNSNTKFKIQIAKLIDVKLIIYDALGREVSTLVNERMKHGTYEVEWDASNLPSGIYFCRLTADDYLAARRMVLLK